MSIRDYFYSSLSYHEDSSLESLTLTNFSPSKYDLYVVVMDRYGKEVQNPAKLLISKKAFDIKGNPLPNLYALNFQSLEEVRDMSPFWEIFREEKIRFKSLPRKFNPTANQIDDLYNTLEKSLNPKFGEETKCQSKN